ncbi:MAG: diguanylate cyclase [Planctomycetota bacterium]
MKLRDVLMVLAAVLAGVTLLLAGYEAAVRFAEKRADALELAFALCAVATAIACLVILDWAKNLHLETKRRSGSRTRREAEAEGPDRRRLSQAERRLLDAVHALDALANDELGPEKTIDEALQVVVRFASADTADLWLTDPEGHLEHKAAWANGEVEFGEEPAEPADAEALETALEHRRPFESLEGGVARFLYPLVRNRRGLGVLKLVVPAGGAEEERPNAMQKLGASLARLVHPFARAVRAPDLYDQAVVDRLTGLYTRRHFVNRLTESTGMSRRYGEPMSVILLDVDNFGMLNDRYGHATADRALRDVAALVQDNIRDADSAYRYGADEFAVILPDTDVDRARYLAERLRGAIRAVRPLADEGGKIIVSVSVGVAEFDEDMRGIGPLIAHAEGALYRAKTTGQDRVVTWSDDLEADDPAEAD